MKDKNYPGCAVAKERTCVHGAPWGKGTCSFCNSHNERIITVDPIKRTKTAPIHIVAMVRDNQIETVVMVTTVLNRAHYAMLGALNDSGREDEAKSLLKDFADGLITDNVTVTMAKNADGELNLQLYTHEMNL